MYSDNDYRYYLERQLMESNDFLAHYGVKGMKWKDHRTRMNWSDYLNQTKKQVDKIERKTKVASKKVKKKATKDFNSFKKSAKATGKEAKRKADRIGKKAKVTAKKAYKYADDHVDRYSYNSRDEKGSYRSTGVRVKTKKATTDVGVYARSSRKTTKKGKSVPTGGDLGVEVARNNKKKRKVSYGSAGIGTTYGIPVSVYRHRSIKY